MGGLLAARVMVLVATASAGVGKCRLPNGTISNCGPSNEQCGIVPRPVPHPQFHIMDASCAVNDPNGFFFDSKHQLYHLFYQDHLSEDNAHTPWLGNRYGPVWGHVVSKDLVSWARLPVALW